MKTILLVVGQGFSARYLLRSGFFQVLRNSGVRIVILSPSADEQAFVDEFKGENIIFEQYYTEGYDQGNEKVKLFFTLSRLYSFNNKYRNNFTDYWRDWYFAKRKNGSTSVRLKDSLLRGAIYLSDRSRLYRNISQAVEGYLTKPVHQAVFEKYKPTLMVTTSLGTLSYDRFIMHEAKRNNVKVLTCVLSWDNPTTKGIAGSKADYVVAWTDTMRHELSAYHDVLEKNIFVGGVPQYDTYFNKQHNNKKGDICKKYGLDPSKKIIFYCLESPTAYIWNVKLLEMMTHFVKNKRFSKECQLLVRLHPIYYKVKNGVRVFEKEINELKNLQKMYHFIDIDYPETVSRKLSFDMPASEIYKLGEFLEISDVVICFYSSIVIEASIYDVPVINIALYHKNDLPNEVVENHAHNKRVLETGGVCTVYDDKSLLDAINRYLIDRSADRTGRQQIVANEAGPNRGNAGKTIGKHVLSLLEL